MHRKTLRSLALLLLFAMALSLSVFAGKPALKKVTIKTLPEPSGKATASYALSQLSLLGGEAVDENDKPVEGEFTWTEPDKLLSAGASWVYVTFTPKEKDVYETVYTGVLVYAYKLNLTVKLLPTVEGKLKAGEKVSTLKLTGGTAVNHFDKERKLIDGHYEFVDGEQSFDSPGTYDVAVVFKPDNAERYNDTVTTYVRHGRGFLKASVKVTVE